LKGKKSLAADWNEIAYHPTSSLVTISTTPYWLEFIVFNFWKRRQIAR